MVGLSPVGPVVTQKRRHLFVVRRGPERMKDPLRALARIYRGRGPVPDVRAASPSRADVLSDDASNVVFVAADGPTDDHQAVEDMLERSRTSADLSQSSSPGPPRLSITRTPCVGPVDAS